MSKSGHFKPHPVGPIKPAVCKSLLTDSDWKTTKYGFLQRGCITVCPHSGQIHLDGVNYPLNWGQRRCVKGCIRKRLDKSFRAAGRDFQHKGHGQ